LDLGICYGFPRRYSTTTARFYLQFEVWTEQLIFPAGIQWFIPYFLAMAALAIPVLILEVSIGSSLRGGPFIAFNALNKRARGSGLGNIWVTLLVVLYYVPMLAWVLRFFRASFENPLP
jgi:solute carrier family 6 GABA transporter-like protein 1